MSHILNRVQASIVALTRTAHGAAGPPSLPRLFLTKRFQRIDAKRALGR